MARAIAGPQKGSELTTVPITHTSWAAWRARHPRTEVLSTETDFERDYSRDPYDGYDKVPRLMFDVQHRDERLPLKAWVMGVVIGGKLAPTRSTGWHARSTRRGAGTTSSAGSESTFTSTDRRAAPQPTMPKAERCPPSPRSGSPGWPFTREPTCPRSRE